eukprot:UN16150
MYNIAYTTNQFNVIKVSINFSMYAHHTSSG